MKTVKFVLFNLLLISFIIGCKECPEIESEKDKTILGCTDPQSCNYNPQATESDGSCEYVSCVGCTNPEACNYNPNATIDNGDCDLTSCYGCTDSTARNFDSNATKDDGSCDFRCTVTGNIGNFIVTKVPAENVNVKFEVEINGVLSLRTKNKLFTNTGNTIFFTQADYDFNKEGNLNIIRFPQSGGIMKIKFFVDNVLVEEKEYNTCYIEGNITIKGNTVPQYYYSGGSNCRNGSCTITAGIHFQSISL